MAYILISLCSLMLIDIARLEAFSYHETINIVKKSFGESDYSLGPEFDKRGSFVYVKVKELDTIPPAIRVSLKIFDKSSSMVTQSNKLFDADADSTNISVTSINLHPTILTINEQKKNGENKTVLVEWHPLSYLDPDLHLPMNNYAIVTRQHDRDFGVLINNNATCHTFNCMCRIEFDIMYVRNSEKKEFFNGDLVWSGMHIGYISSDYFDKYFIRGFDTVGNYKLMYCDVWREHACTELFSLSNANSVIDRGLDNYSSDRGFCFIVNPGEDTSLNCLKFDLNNYGKVILNKTVTYNEPMNLLEMIDDVDTAGNSEILLVANKYHCVRSDCLHVTINKISIDPTKPIVYRDLTLKCSNQEKLFKVSITKVKSIKALVIEYICEGNEEFIFKSATIDDKLIS